MNKKYVCLFAALLFAYAGSAQLFFRGGVSALEHEDIRSGLDSMFVLNQIENPTLQPLQLGYQTSMGYLITLRKERSLFVAPLLGVSQMSTRLLTADSISIQFTGIQAGVKLFTGPRSWFDVYSPGPVGNRLMLALDIGVAAAEQRIDFQGRSLEKKMRSIAPYCGGELSYRLLVLGKRLVMSPYVGAVGYYNQRFQDAAKFLTHEQRFNGFPTQTLNWNWQVGFEFCWLFSKKKIPYNI
ncbi:MAG: hypothetical protein ACK5EW_05385 [Bacteroidota bacterium]|jgi:hypothetical protein